MSFRFYDLRSFTNRFKRKRTLTEEVPQPEERKMISNEELHAELKAGRIVICDVCGKEYEVWPDGRRSLPEVIHHDSTPHEFVWTYHREVMP